MVLLALILTGCSTSLKQLETASKKTGQVQAGIDLPTLPPECEHLEAHAELILGEEALSVLKRERAALERQHGITMDCAQFYKDVFERFTRNKHP